MSSGGGPMSIEDQEYFRRLHEKEEAQMRQTDLPVPPMPQDLDHLEDELQELTFAKTRDLFRACVYEHLWREESTRHSDLAAGHEYAKCCRAINQCAERARELNHG